MGLFSRRDREGAGQPQVNGTKRSRHVHSTYSMATRPSFGQWLKVTWVDILTFVIMGAIGLGIYEAPPAPTRSFAVTFSDGEIVYPEFAYPLRKEIIPIWLAAFLAAVVPILAILIMQIRVRSFWDVNNGIIGLLYSLIGAAVFQVFLKFLIGGLRPHFLDVCKPDISLATSSSSPYDAAGFNQIYYTREICTGDPKEINDSLESFPSGHSTAAFAGFVYLYLYLNAKLKVFANYHPAMWKLIIIYIPILGAVLIAGALTIDEFHNWYDVCIGAVIGTVFAFSAYRMNYAAIWDWRWNHVPLNRSQPFSYAYDGAELMDAMWTRKAGWGAGSSYNNRQATNGQGMYSSGAAGPGVPRKAVPNSYRQADDMV
ncbi:phosphatidic acid phosphatase type 2/haloperoxidase [Hypoxylon argillaceum]|nr:phosphatidic acid phosphatase type 2/haloperoxidase [Hypoxylon argillaceum]KAI1150381.1 phosphatidic acid phosphatase type 2/haloperoxidase [Nemania diffusa]